jgi:hypothetical protein
MADQAIQTICCMSVLAVTIDCFSTRRFTGIESFYTAPHDAGRLSFDNACSERLRTD